MTAHTKAARVRRTTLVAAAIVTAAGSLSLAQTAVAAAGGWRHCSGSNVSRSPGGTGVLVDHYRVRGSRRQCATARKIARVPAAAFATSGQVPRSFAFRHHQVRCSSSPHLHAVRRVTCAARYRFDVSPEFGRTPLLDSFARPGPLSPSWLSPGLQDTGTITVTGAGLTGGVLSTTSAPTVDGGNGASSATWKTPFGPGQEARLTVMTLPATPGEWVQLATRVSSQSKLIVSCYFLRITPSANRWELRQKVNGETSTPIKSFMAPLAAGDTIGLKVQGSTLTAYRRPGPGPWVLVGSATSTAVTAGGFVAFTLQGASAQGGAFGGGSIPPT